MATDDKKRRTLSILVGATLGGGLVAGAVPFVASLYPGNDKERPFLDIKIDKLKPGQLFVVSWMGQPLYVLKRTEAMLSELSEEKPELRDPNSEGGRQPKAVKNIFRSLEPKVFVAWGMCTHLGCSVSYNPPGENSELSGIFARGAFHCPCHGAVYDLAGRVYVGMPAPRNLDVPDYEFVDASTLRITRDVGF